MTEVRNEQKSSTAPSLERIASGPSTVRCPDDVSWVLARELLVLQAWRREQADALVEARQRLDSHNRVMTSITHRVRALESAPARSSHAKPEGDCCFYEGNTCMHVDEMIRERDEAIEARKVWMQVTHETQQQLDAARGALAKVADPLFAADREALRKIATDALEPTGGQS